MEDQKLVALIAHVWIVNGGDSIGFLLLYRDIFDKIKEMD